MPTIIKSRESRDEKKKEKLNGWIAKGIVLLIALGCFGGCTKIQNDVDKKEKVTVKIVGKEYDKYTGDYIIEYMIDDPDPKYDNDRNVRRMEITMSSYNNAKIDEHQTYSLPRSQIYGSCNGWNMFSILILAPGFVISGIAFIVLIRGIKPYDD